MAAIVPARTSGYISAHGITQDGGGIRGIRFILIQISTSINLGHELKRANT